MMSLTKKPHPPSKNFFFECNLLDWPIRLSLEQLSSAIGGGARALVGNQKLLFFLQKSPKPPRRQGVNTLRAGVRYICTLISA